MRHHSFQDTLLEVSSTIRVLGCLNVVHPGRMSSECHSPPLFSLHFKPSRFLLGQKETSVLIIFQERVASTRVTIDLSNAPINSEGPRDKMKTGNDMEAITDLWAEISSLTIPTDQSTEESTVWESGGDTRCVTLHPVLPTCRPSETSSAATSTPSHTRADSTSGKPSSTEVI